MTLSPSLVPLGRLLSTTALTLVLATPAAAWAEDASQVSEVTIVGKRDAIISAQTLQQEAASVTSVISGEELREQPQANIADLLTRVPGINSSADMSRNHAGTGEAQYVSIRGLDTSYNAFSLNGVRLAQTDANTRSISMNLLSPFSMQYVSINKAPTADLDGDAIAGIVDFRTATAFDLKDGYRKVLVQGQFAQMADERGQDPYGYAFQGEFAERFGDADQFGLYVNAYLADKDTYGESTAFQKEHEKNNNNIPGPLRENEDNLFARGVQWNAFRNNIQRKGVTLNLDYAGENHKAYVYATHGAYRLKSWMDQSSIRNELATALGQINPNGGAYNAAGLREDYGVMGGLYHRTEHSDQTLTTLRVGGESRFDAFVFDYHLAYSKGEQDYPLRIESAFYGLPFIGTADQTGTATKDGLLITATADEKHPRVLLTPTAAAYVGNLHNLRQYYVQAGYEKTWEEKTEFAFNGAWESNFGPLKLLKAGVKYETADRSSTVVDTGAKRHKFSAPYSPVHDEAIGAFNTRGEFADLFPGKMVTGFMGGLPQAPLKLLDTGRIEQMARDYSLARLPADAARYGTTTGDEKRTAVYVMARFETGDLTVIPGLRYERNQYGASNYRDVYQTGKPDRKELVSSDRTYSMLLPSLVATYRPNERTVYRASIRKSYSRPAFDQLFGSTEISYDAQDRVEEIYEPNPNLKPVKSVDLDLAAEFYGDDSDMISVALYYKKLSDMIFSSGSTNTSGNNNAWGAGVVSPTGVTVVSTQNGGEGTVYGVELMGRYRFRGLPDWADGLGVMANVTLQRSRGETYIQSGGVYKGYYELPLPHAPDVMYNLGLNYERGPFAAALNYNYTDQRLRGVRGNRPHNFIQPVAKLNFSSTYRFNDNLRFGVSVENILDEHNYWATIGERSTILSDDRKGGYVKVGRTFQINATYAF